MSLEIVPGFVVAAGEPDDGVEVEGVPTSWRMTWTFYDRAFWMRVVVLCMGVPAGWILDVGLSGLLE